METPDKEKMWRVLFDLNVLLDVLMNREPFVADSARLWALAETGQIQGFVAGHSLTTLFYLYRRQNSIEKVYQVLRKILQIFDVAIIDRNVIESAIDLNWRDFEDAVQAMSAEEVGCDYLVTRDPDDFQDQQMTIIQPADFLAVWSSK